MSDKKYTSIWEGYGVDSHNVNIFIGMRGMGKTFSLLGEYTKGRYDVQHKLLYTRLTRAEFRVITSPAGNAFKKINEKLGCRYAFFPLKDDLFTICQSILDPDSLKDKEDGPVVGYASHIVLLRKVSGIGMEDVAYFAVDEFIPKNRSDYRGDKYEDIMGVWETINRNREEEGKDPCKLILLSNSYDIYDSLLVGFNLVQEAEKMIVEGRENYFDEVRSIGLHILRAKEEYVDFKSQTAVARATKGTRYGDMAFSNEFAFNDFAYVEPCKDYRGSKPMFSLNLKAYFYKMPNGSYYVSYRRAECPDYPIFTDIYRRFFRQRHPRLADLIATGRVRYQSYELKEIVMSALK